MTKGVSVQEVIASGDEHMVRQKLIGLLEHVEDGMGMPITIYCALACAIELERLATKRVEKSSHRLEKLSWALITLTIILGLLALPPAWEVVKHWF